jgi:hypothetical protein
VALPVSMSLFLARDIARYIDLMKIHQTNSNRALLIEMLRPLLPLILLRPLLPLILLLHVVCIPVVGG